MTPDDLDLPERVLSRIVPEPMSECWLWSGYTNTKGYGVVGTGSRTQLVHRVVLGAATGHTEEQAMHLCDTPACCYPNHLAWGTNQTNQRDKARKGRSNNGQIIKTHCKAMHPFDEANTYITPSGSRSCRACRARRSLEFRGR